MLEHHNTIDHHNTIALWPRAKTNESRRQHTHNTKNVPLDANMREDYDCCRVDQHEAVRVRLF